MPTAPHSSLSNGVPERYIGLTREGGRTSRLKSGLPPSTQLLADGYHCYVMNWTPRANEKRMSSLCPTRPLSPFELDLRIDRGSWKELFSHLAPFGCECIATKTPDIRQGEAIGKAAHPGERGVLLGRDESGAQWLMLSLERGTYIRARALCFNMDVFPFLRANKLPPQIAELLTEEERPSNEGSDISPEEEYDVEEEDEDLSLIIAQQRANLPDEEIVENTAPEPAAAPKLRRSQRINPPLKKQLFESDLFVINEEDELDVAAEITEADFPALESAATHKYAPGQYLDCGEGNGPFQITERTAAGDYMAIWPSTKEPRLEYAIDEIQFNRGRINTMKGKSQSVTNLFLALLMKKSMKLAPTLRLALRHPPSTVGKR